MATTTKAEQIDVKQAMRLAIEYFYKLYGNSRNVTLEEVEESVDGKFLLVTLGYDPEPQLLPKGGHLEEVFGVRRIRNYKVFKIDIRKGRVMSMKMRPVD